MKKKNEISKALEELSNLDLNDITNIVNNEFSEIAVPSPLNLDELKLEAENEAREIIDVFFNFLIKNKIIEESIYLNIQKKFNINTYKSVLFQIYCLDKAITMLLNNIAMGEMSPRMFEALSVLEKTYIELLRIKIDILNNLELKIKAMNLEIDEQINNKLNGEENKENNNISKLRVMGTREINKIIKNVENSNNIRNNNNYNEEIKHYHEMPKEFTNLSNYDYLLDDNKNENEMDINNLNKNKENDNKINLENIFKNDNDINNFLNKIL